ncbi:hypothetical protein [Hydrogenophaga sp. IBVHS1]|uniref:hypothetical protein n=1 Tax=unclassified Hydrogenophaga TaxID=2610897 RepID=UPI00117AD2ED|nr:hypothetical protein [Hydrogenophaga sp. IBVHS1]
MKVKSANTLLCAGALMCASSTGALAQHSVRILTEVERIENPGLLSVNLGGATVLRAAAEYSYVSSSDRIRSRFSAGAVLERSSNTLLLASRNYPSLGYTWAYNWPTANLELRANLAEAATRNTQFEELGLVTVDARERTVVTGAQWNKDLTERTQLRLDVANNRVSYDSAVLAGYRELEMTSRLSWAQSERTTYYFEPGYARLTPLGAGAESNLTRWAVGTRGELSPNWALGAFAGQARASGAASIRTALGGLQLTYTGSQLTSGIEWSRDLQPVGTAASYVRTEALGLVMGYQLTQSARISASTTRSRSGGVAGGVGHLTRLTLENELSERWSSTLGVEDRKFRGVTGTTGRGWAIRAGLIYLYSEL